MKKNSIRRRGYHNAEERQRWVALYHQSDLTQEDFARRHGLSFRTLKNWLARSRQSGAVTASAAPVFQEIKLPEVDAGQAWAAEVSLDNQVTLRLSQSADTDWVRSLIQTLRQSC